MSPGRQARGVRGGGILVSAAIENTEPKYIMWDTVLLHGLVRRSKSMAVLYDICMPLFLRSKIMLLSLLEGSLVRCIHGRQSNLSCLGNKTDRWCVKQNNVFN